MSGTASRGVPLSSIFDPFVAGTTPARATGITDGAGDLNTQFANIIYGGTAAATGIESENADINTLFAKIGTAQYALTCNGVAYLAPTPTAANCAIYFNWNTTGWSVTSPVAITGSPVSGSLNSGATQYYMTRTDAPGINGAIVTNAVMGAWTNLAAGLYVEAATSGPGTDIAKTTITIQLRNAGGTVLSTSTFSIAAKYTGI